MRSSLPEKWWKRLPFCIWQLKGYYDTIPVSLEEAAGIDGCSRWQAFRLVVLPLAGPALVITALFSFMTAWNEYVVAALILQDVEIFTLPVGLAQLIVGDVQSWGVLMAASLLTAIPVVVIYMLGQRFMVAGLTAGSVKG